MNKNAGRRLLLLLTDGRDFSEGGSTTKNEIDKLLNKADVPLYAFGIGSSKETLIRWARWQGATEETTIMPQRMPYLP